MEYYFEELYDRRFDVSRRSSPMRFLAVCVFCIGSLLVGPGSLRAAQPPSRYPLDLDTAIAKAYPGTFAGIQRSCTVWLNGGRDEYALAAVSLRGGRSDIAGFQFINTAGWFNMWRLHATTAGVPTTQRATVARLIRDVSAKCNARWTP